MVLEDYALDVAAGHVIYLAVGSKHVIALDEIRNAREKEVDDRWFLPTSDIV